MSAKHPVTIRQRTFASKTEAAKFHKVCLSTIIRAEQRGTLDSVGYGSSLPVIYRGKKYDSQSAFARAVGISRQAVSHTLILGNGDLDDKDYGNG